VTSTSTGYGQVTEILASRGVEVDDATKVLSVSGRVNGTRFASANLGCLLSGNDGWRYFVCHTHTEVKQSTAASKVQHLAPFLIPLENVATVVHWCHS
jgi:hypothetical protein